MQLYYRMLHLSNVDSKGTCHQDQLILKEMDHCSRKELRCIFDHFSKKTRLQWLSCLVLANRDQSGGRTQRLEIGKDFHEKHSENRCQDSDQQSPACKVWQITTGPLRSWPLRSWPLRSWPRRSWPLRSWPLSAWPLRSWPLRSWPLSAWPLSAWPLRSRTLPPERGLNGARQDHLFNDSPLLILVWSHSVLLLTSPQVLLIFSRSQQVFIFFRSPQVLLIFFRSPQVLLIFYFFFSPSSGRSSPFLF
ncbi:unnamed protein product [Arctogadus glacialis]